MQHSEVIELEKGLTKYRRGQLVRVDLFTCGFPTGKVLEVVEPGNGVRSLGGLVRVKLTQSCKGYKAGEIIEERASDVVPLPHVSISGCGQYRINTQFEWVKGETK